MIKIFSDDPMSGTYLSSDDLALLVKSVFYAIENDSLSEEMRDKLELLGFFIFCNLDKSD